MSSAIRTFCFAWVAAALMVASPCMGQQPLPQSERWEPVPPDERLVGIAYTSWHRDLPWNNTWGEPVLGDYLSDNREVIRTHAKWLAGAGVDFVWPDWSNNVEYVPGESNPNTGQGVIENSTTIMFEEYAELPKDERPKISIFLGTTGSPEAVNDGRLQRKAEQIWEQYYSNPKYENLVQEYLGKPLLVVYVNTPSPWPDGTPDWDDPRFTVRWMTGYVSEQTSLRTEGGISKYGYWSWEDRALQTFPIYDGYPESMVVTASYRPQGEPGDEAHIPAEPRLDGETFRERWNYVQRVGPKFAMVVSWNEWSTGEQPSPEVSKDIEPSERFGDQYLEILEEEIAEFKEGE